MGHCFLKVGHVCNYLGNMVSLCTCLYIPGFIGTIVNSRGRTAIWRTRFIVVAESDSLSSDIAPINKVSDDVGLVVYEP